MIRARAPQEDEHLRIVGVDIEAQHGATWSAKYDGRMFYGAALGGAETWEGGVPVVSYLPPGAAPLTFKAWIAPLLQPDIVVVAHNGTYDLEGLNGESIRLGFGPLPSLRLSDTLKHGYKNGGMFSRTLGDLCKHYHLPVMKGSISRHDWERAYRAKWGRRTDWEILRQLRAYNEDDVRCVLLLREAMIEAGDLRFPWRKWTPGSEGK